MNKWFKAFLYCSLIWGIFFTGMGISDFNKPNYWSENFAPWLVLGIAPLAFSAIFLYMDRMATKRKKEIALERDLLNLANRFNGMLTASEVAINLQLSVEESRIQLEKFVIKGLADTEVTDAGVVAYRFRELA